jgi:hypothetical protein
LIPFGWIVQVLKSARNLPFAHYRSICPPTATAMSAITTSLNGVQRSVLNGDAANPETEQKIKTLHPKLTLSRPGYPTQSLRFLRHISNGAQSYDANRMNLNEQPARPCQLKLRIVVVGAGLAGLATAIALSRRGHSVMVLEQAPELGEV